MTTPNPTRLLIACAAALAMSVSRGVETVGDIVTVPAGASLQSAIDRARPGDTLALDAGATYVGNFVLPVKPGNEYITIRTAGDGAGLPASGQRVLPGQAPRLAKLKS